MESYTLLRHFPTTSMAAYAIADKQFAVTKPLEYTFNITRFEDTLSSLHLIGNYSFIAGDRETSLFKRK